MANVKISALPAASAVAALTDLLAAVQDAVGTPSTRKLTYQQLFDALSILSAAGAAGDSDIVPVTQSGVAKAMTLLSVADYVNSFNVWNSSNSLIRRVLYTTGATSVAMGETASSSGTGSVSAKAVSLTNPQGANFTTGAVSGNTFGWTSTAHHITGIDTTYEFVIAWPETTSVRYLCGIGSNNAVNMSGSGDTPGTAFHVAMLRWSTNVPDTNLQFLTGNASAQQVTDLGVAKPAGTFRLRIVTRGAGTAIDVYINSVLVATGINTNLPTNTQIMQMTGCLTTLTNAAKVANLYEEAAAETP